MGGSLIPSPKRNTKSIASFISLVIAAAFASAARADSSDSAAASSSGKVLKGDVHDAGTLVPSATLIPGTDQVQPMRVQQYAGSEQDKRHPNRQPTGPVPPKTPPGTAGKVQLPPPPAKLWGTVNDDERPPNAPPTWGEAPPPRPVTPPGPAAPKTPAAKTPVPALPDRVMTYQAGHAVVHVKQPTAQSAQSVHLTWAELQAILLNKQRLMPDAKRRSAGPQQLTAKQLVLPHHVAANWSEWYRAVAHAIYQVWQQEQVCPGTTTVRTTIFAGQDVDCKIFDFKPAEDVKRNASAESFFREAALKSVNSINKSAVCEFPTGQHPNKVVFDIQLTRLVNGPAGCDVIHTHQSPTMGAEQK